ncbi:hypothetical protein TRIUR3_34669 [Triticum urartu]|uniref:Uncharacterized protein n=1 Tax=Triticum urartu TaxID=4572 RepID=M7YIM4_TRIUA|nr:hypothetical protein TRIUR3_34669 [Triticum urartu]
MASPSKSARTTTFPLPRLRDLIEHDEEDEFLEEEEEEDDDDWDIRKRMSLLTVEGSDGGDADDEEDGSADVDEEDEDEVRSHGLNGEYESQPWHPQPSLDGATSGDDPKDVKARLKVWAQAVALSSASRLGS